jgi:hypothetical protein
VTISNGSFELPLLMVTEIDDAGLIGRHELYDHERIDEAFARFEEIEAAATRGASSRFANEASRALDRSIRRFNARDWDGMVATFAPEHRMDDRRRLVRLEVDERQFLENERWLYELPGAAFEASLVATRGDRLALCRVKFTAGGGDTGPMAVEVLDLVEVDDTGRRTALVVFDPDDLSSARHELDERFDRSRK